MDTWWRLYLRSIDDNDDTCMRFAKEASCVVVSVDYRLAPEHPYPAPIEDCYSALKWIADNACKVIKH